MPLVVCKVQLKHNWTNHCVLSANSNDNTDADPNNIIFIIKDINSNVPVVTLSEKFNQKL